MEFRQDIAADKPRGVNRVDDRPVINGILFALALWRRFLAHRDRRGVTTDMSDDALSQRFSDQGFIHPSCEVVHGKFIKGPRKGGFTRYYTHRTESTSVETVVAFNAPLTRLSRTAQWYQPH